MTTDDAGFHHRRLRELGISQVALAASATEALKPHEEKFDHHL
jgi:hypothetical protein